MPVLTGDTLFMDMTNEKSLMQVLVVDDHPAFCMGVAALIQKLGFVHVCGQANDATHAMDLFSRLQPEIVVMDISLPDGNGIELTHVMKQQKQDVVILILSMHEESVYAAKALRAGAAGYLRKGDDLQELAVALKNISEHQPYVSSCFSEDSLLKAIGDESDEGSLLNQLSRRQREVFNCLGSGMSQNEIAGHLDLSVKTVETHRTLIKKKLGLLTADEVTKLARNWHAVEHDEAIGSIGLTTTR